MLAVALGSLATPAVYSAMLTRTFERRRGLALGFTLSFAGLGVAILPLLASFIIERWNWRVAYGTFAGLAVLGAIAIFCLLPRRAGVGALLGSVMADADAKASPAEGTIAGDRTFWTMAAIFVLLAVAANSVPLHLPQILRERGANLHLAAASLGVMGITMIVGRPFVGYLLDVLPIRAVLAITLGGPLAGSIALLTSGGAASALLASIGFGLAIGGEFACLGYMVSRAYGTHRFGFVYGWLAMAVASGVALGPIGISILLRLGRGYAPPLLMVVAACILALGATLTLREDRFSARPST
jgi:MFS family permease